MSNLETGKVAALSVSEKRGGAKQNVESIRILEGWGVEGDGHGGDWHRQVSLLAMESVRKMQGKGFTVEPGDFGENITTEGVNLLSLDPGDRVSVGEALLEITQLGKECKKPCEIYYQVGDCVMPKEGIFGKVLRGGSVRNGDPVILNPE